MLVMICVVVSPFSYAHSGRTDSSGGHKDNKNKSGLGYYHYHHGMGPHLHTNGICPYSISYDDPIVYDSTVKTYQNKLNNIGYSCGSADGLHGSKTTSAIKRFQNDNNLVVDGELNRETKSKIDEKVNSFKNVKVNALTRNEEIQLRLNELGYNCGVVDGKIGPITRKAIMKFQRDNNLEVDGNVGPITFKKLGLN
jgi:peptidoglycan hydrolase-like protein with peptidoglycan-binding domain